jgi:hypothetical protein
MGNDAFESCADDLCVAECQTCGRWFDERAYQVIVWGLGSFDSVECAEKAVRRARRSAGANGLLQASQQRPQTVPSEQPQTVAPESALTPEKES